MGAVQKAQAELPLTFDADHTGSDTAEEKHPRGWTAQKRVLFLVLGGNDGSIARSVNSLCGKFLNVYVRVFFVTDLESAVDQIDRLFSSEESEVHLLVDCDHQDLWDREVARTLGTRTDISVMALFKDGSRLAACEELMHSLGISPYETLQKKVGRNKVYWTIRNRLVRFCRITQ